MYVQVDLSTDDHNFLNNLTDDHKSNPLITYYYNNVSDGFEIKSMTWLGTIENNLSAKYQETMLGSTDHSFRLSVQGSVRKALLGHSHSNEELSADDVLLAFNAKIESIGLSSKTAEQLHVKRIDIGTIEECSDIAAKLSMYQTFINTRNWQVHRYTTGLVIGNKYRKVRIYDKIAEEEGKTKIFGNLLRTEVLVQGNRNLCKYFLSDDNFDKEPDWNAYFKRIYQQQLYEAHLKILKPVEKGHNTNTTPIQLFELQLNKSQSIYEAVMYVGIINLYKIDYQHLKAIVYRCSNNSQTRKNWLTYIRKQLRYFSDDSD